MSKFSAIIAFHGGLFIPVDNPHLQNVSHTVSTNLHLILFHFHCHRLPLHFKRLLHMVFPQICIYWTQLLRLFFPSSSDMPSFQVGAEVLSVYNTYVPSQMIMLIDV